MIVTIDGPAGAGKSSVARALAERLNFEFLDTGAMYRAVAWFARRKETDWCDPSSLQRAAESIKIDFHDGRVLVNGQDVTREIRTPEVTSIVGHAADNLAVRQHLVRLQRDIAKGTNLVTEGRDQGTVAFPESECKIFLTATARERAKRRVVDFDRQGKPVDYAEVLAQITDRDKRDENREVGALVAADDALVVVTDGMTMDEVVQHLEQIVRARMSPGE